MRSLNIGIDKGHTFFNGGCCGAVGLLNESIENREVGNRLINMLQFAGHNVVDCSCNYASDSNEQLKAIVQKANSQHLDLFFSIHLNASNGEGYGAEIYTTPGSKATDIAKSVINDYCNDLGIKNRGYKNANYFVLKNTNAPAMLIELIFVDNAGDKAKWDSLSYDAIATTLYKAILRACNIEGANIPPIQEKPNTSENNAIQRAKEYIGARCKELQSKLIKLGYNCGGFGADGEFGQGTYNSLIQFQKDFGLAVDGLAGENTFATLNNEIAKREKVYYTIQKGSKGALVKEAQQLLIAKGYSVGNTGADGDFGMKTEKAVKLFQDNNGLAVDGIVGKNTWAKLLA